MSKYIKQGVDLEYVEVANKYGKKIPGMKISPSTCKFLDNFVLTDVKTELTYELDIAFKSKDLTVLRECMVTPEPSSGIKTTFTGVLYNKPIVISVRDTNHTDYGNHLNLNWLHAFNIILQSVYGMHFDTNIDEYCSLTDAYIDVVPTIKYYINSIELNEGQSIYLDITKDCEVSKPKVIDKDIFYS